jgi:DNA repair protein RadC
MCATENRLQTLALGALNSTEKESLIKLALKLLTERHRRGRLLTSTDETRAFLRLKLADYQSEVFGVLFLDNRHRVIKVAELFHGSVAGAAVHPRVVVQRALEFNAAAVVFFHNHPSGVAEPSLADEAITRRLREALSLVDVRVLDHFVVAAGESVSFAERGLL